jgi:hypothetical protein
MKYSRYSLIIVIAFVVTSCGSNISQLPEQPYRKPWLAKWLVAPTCQPPCWENIIPGTTSSADALELLNQIPNIKIAYQDTTTIEWLLNGTDSGGIADTNGLVSSITLEIPKEELLFISEVNSAYGPPAQVRLYRCLQGFCEVHLTYPSHNMVITLLVSNKGINGDQVEVESYSKVDRIVLYQSLDMFQNSLPDFRGTFQNWRGYGVYPY